MPIVYVPVHIVMGMPMTVGMGMRVAVAMGMKIHDRTRSRLMGTFESREWVKMKVV